MTIEKVQMQQVVDDLGRTSVIYPETSADNVLMGDGTTVEQAITNKVTYNGKNDSKQNFNFIENKVIQDGLVERYTNLSKSTSTSKVSNNYTLMGTFTLIDLNLIKTDSVWYLADADLLLYVRYDGAILSRTSAGTGHVVLPPGTFKYSVPNNVVVMRNMENVFISINGNNTTFKAPTDGSSRTYLPIGHFTSTSVNFNGGALINNAMVYNRQLTHMETKHNFQILNNTPALKSTEITDSEGVKSTHLFESDEDHVEMSTGRTLRDEYMGVLSTMGKEFTADATGKIDMNNGVKNSRLISGEVQGQTVKNVKQTQETVLALPTSEAWVHQGLGVNALNSNTSYTIVFEILKPIDTYLDVQLRTFNNITAGFSNVRIPANSKGLFSASGTTTEVEANRNNVVTFTMPAGRTLNGEVRVLGVLVGTYDKPIINSHIPFGLFSTQAIISNNGQQYPIYEPTIQGKTRILKAAKGTQNWIEISPNEVRDTVAYDYKLDSINGDLGSVGSITDVVDRNSKVKGGKTESVALNGTEDWVLSSIKENTIQYSKPLPRAILSSPIMCDTARYNSDGSDTERINLTSALFVNISKSKLLTQDVSGLKTYLRDNPITIRYQLVAPTTIQLTDEQMKAYDAYKKLILLPFQEDKLILNDDGSATWINASDKKRLEFTPIQGIEVTIEGAFARMTYPIKSKIGASLVGEWELENANAITSEEWSSKTVEGLYYGTTAQSGISIQVSQLPEGFASMTQEQQQGAVIKYLNDRNIIATFTRANRNTVHIPKELVPAILTDKINILEVKSPVAPSSFKVVAPVDKNAEQDAEIKNLKDRLNTVMNVLYANPLLVNTYIDQEVADSQKIINEGMM